MTVNVDAGIVIELKANNPRAIALGKRQVEAYRRELEAMFGKSFKSQDITCDRP